MSEYTDKLTQARNTDSKNYFKGRCRALTGHHHAAAAAPLRGPQAAGPGTCAHPLLLDGAAQGHPPAAQPWPS